MQSIGVLFKERRPKAAYGHLLPQGEKEERRLDQHLPLNSRFNSQTFVIASEAKQSISPRRKSGLLRRFRLRSLSYGGQVAPRNDGALTQLDDLAAHCA